jgi:hypothetical protein
MPKHGQKRGARTLQSHVQREAAASSKRIARYTPEYRAWMLRQMVKLNKEEQKRNA